MLKKIDIYIIKKFIGTFFFSIVLIISIAIIFDISEKIDAFVDKQVPLKTIIMEHYLMFIPYFANLFSYLFIFISVIFFTSKMAQRTEIIAILSSGISLRRLLWGYFLSALFLSIMSFFLSAYIIPPANKIRIKFEDTYINHKFRNFDKHLHKQIQPGIYVYMDNYNVDFNIGYKFTLSKYENNELKSKLSADYIQWDSIQNKWILNNYVIRTIDSLNETIVKGYQLDTSINMYPKDFRFRYTIVETLNLTQLNQFIAEQEMQGSENVISYKIYKYKMFSYPFSAFILTLIGFVISMRKTRGGIGLHIGLGLFMSFAYIVFMQFSTNFAIGGSMNPILAVWTPNIIFTIIAVILYKYAPK
ncbi:MAG: LptF/LptG family permease [Marinilabiliales bacterium]